MAEATDRSVIVPIYPLTPEHTHRDVFPTLQRLYAKVAAEYGVQNLAVMGDSAGGQPALALVQSMSAGTPQPAQLILLSPGLDATLTNPEIASREDRDPIIEVAHAATLNRWYAEPDDPAIAELSPINGPLNDLGRVAVFTGTRDVLNPDAHRLRNLTADQPGTELSIHEYEGMVHDWMFLPIPEARQARNAIIKILETQPAMRPTP